MREALYNSDAITFKGLSILNKFPAADVMPITGHCANCGNWDEETGWCEEHSHFIDSQGGACHPWESVEWKMFDSDYFCADWVAKMGKGNLCDGI